MQSLRAYAIAAAIGAVTMAAMSAEAQVTRVIQAGSSAATLLLKPAVQKELKLTTDQAAKAKTMVDIARKELQEYLRLELPGVDRHGVEEAIEKKRSAMEAAQMTGLKSLLSPDQLKRLKELDFQSAGVAGMLRPQLAGALHLTDGQKEKLQDIEDATQEATQELYQANAAEEESKESAGIVNIRKRTELKGEAAAKLQRLRVNATAKALEIFTAQQRTKWKELTGEPFDFVPVAATLSKL
jgi:hypothetical protein